MTNKIETSSTETTQEQFEKIAKENLSKWNKVLLTKDENIVASLYTKDCTFLPTMSDKLVIGRDGAAKYFHHFLEKKPESKIIEEVVQVISPNAYLHSGMYNFDVVLEDGEKTLEARFTYLWQKNDQGQWKIAHHHSSVKPKG